MNDCPTLNETVSLVALLPIPHAKLDWMVLETVVVEYEVGSKKKMLVVAAAVSLQSRLVMSPAVSDCHSV